MKKVKQTQFDRVLSHLEDGNTLTRLEAWQQLGIMNPTARICELRAAGYPVKTTNIKVKNRWNESCTVAQWSL
jgi:hypothetical protein|tara:strand:+ start:291 stop:509 length:219 start_codon:yes stop_codon:yes gene_type:complete